MTVGTKTDDMADQSAGGTMAMLRALLSKRQRDIIDGLRPFGEMAVVFESGAILRQCDGFPGRGYLVGHAMREIVNRMPDHYEGVEEAGDDSDERERLRREEKQQLFTQWRGAVGDLSLGDSESRPTAEVAVTIAMDLALPLNRWITQEANVEGERADALAKTLGHFHGVYPEEMSRVAKGLVRLEGEKHAHVPARRKVREESEALEEWDRFEDILHSIVGHRHERQKRMDDDLAEIESW